MTDEQATIHVRTVALALYQIRVLLSDHLGTQNPADASVRQAAHLAYALHNEALALVEGGSFDAQAVNRRLEALDTMLGSHFAHLFAPVLNPTATHLKTAPHLDAVDEVEVVDLRELRPDRVTQYLEAAADARAPRVTIRGREARLVASLWNELPPGEQDRCHVPPFGLRFFSGGQLLLEASLCWECNNIFGVVGTNPFSFAFDACAPSSKALLGRAQETMASGGRHAS